MINKNSTDSSFIQNIGKRIKKLFKLFQKNTLRYQNLLQIIQLTFIYFFAIIVLIYSIKTSLGYFPEIIFKLIPFLKEVLNFPLLKILAAPEKTFILYLLVIEVVINRPIFNFSQIIKYNFLLIFILEMFQNLLISYWDLLFNREIESAVANTILVKNLTIIIFCLIFTFFILLYLYCYIQSIRGIFPRFPGYLSWLTDSIAFWLQIKTPKIGNGKSGNEKRK